MTETSNTSSRSHCHFRAPVHASTRDGTKAKRSLVTTSRPVIPQPSLYRLAANVDDALSPACRSAASDRVQPSSLLAETPGSLIWK